MSEIGKLIDPSLIEKALEGFKAPEEADLFIKALEEYVGIGKSKIEDDLRSIDFVEKPVDMYTFMRDPYYLGIIDSIYPKIVDDLIEFFDPGHEYFLGLMGGAIGYGKCLAGDSLVWTDEGPIRIDKIHKEHLNANVYGFDGEYRLVGIKSIASRCDGVKSVFKLVLTSGSELRATAEHPFLTGDGWKKLNELKTGDLIATARRLPLVSRDAKDKNLVENLIKFLAYMTAEGATGIYWSGEAQSLSCRFTNGNEQILREFERVCLALSSQKVTCVQQNAGSTTIEPKGMRGVLRECGLAGKTSKTKRIPEIVWKFGPNNVSLFLNRLIACDGNVYIGRPPKVEICISSEGLANDVMIALKVLSIHGRKASRVMRNQYKGKQFKAWRVSVSGAAELLKFFETVGPIFSKENYDFIESLKKVDGNSNVDVVPIDYHRLKELRKAVGGIRRQIWDKVRFPNGQLLGKSKWDSVLKLLKDRVPDKFLRLGSSDVFWDRVKLIEYAGEEEVYDLEVPGTRNFIANGIVVHNSTFSEIAIARIIYEVSCLKNPQKTYRMVKEDKLFFANVSVTHTQAKRVIFEGLKGKIKGSEYFRTVFPYQDFATELRFPNNVLLAACTQSQVIGMNTFAAAMDEANFMPIVERSQTARLRGGKRLYDQAEVVFTALIRRMETRYLRFGNLPGKLMALSSAQYPDDFMERKMDLYRGNKNVFVRNYAIWDTKPEGTYSNERFFVFFNKESGLGRIPNEGEAAGEEDETIEIPVEFRHDFEVDMEGSLRDLAGRSTVAIEPFIVKREMIARIYEDNRRHPFSAYETTLRDGHFVLRDVLCEWVREEDELGNIKFEGLRPKVNPKTKRFVHIDPSISGDAAGFGMGHISHYEERMRWRTIQVVEPGMLDPKTKKEAFTEMVPVIYIDLWLRIAPPRGGEIILGDIRQLIFELKDMGFRFGLITMDSFQSKDMQQQLKEKGLNVSELSVDVNPSPYNRLKMAIYEARMKAYMHPHGVNELRQLEWNKRKGKVDHRPASSKDMSDSLAGVVYNCETNVVVEPIAPSLGIAESPVDEEIKRKIQETKWLLGR